MPNNKRDADADKRRKIDQRRERVAKLYLEGHNQQAIADRVSCCVATVCKDLKALQAEWRENAESDFSDKMATEIAKLDKIEATAWEGFRDSKETVETNTNGATIKKTAGEPRFLVIIQNCIDKRCKILGIDAPGRVELSGKNGQPLEVKEKFQLAIGCFADLLEKSKLSLKDEDEE